MDHIKMPLARRTIHLLRATGMALVLLSAAAITAAKPAEAPLQLDGFSVKTLSGATWEAKQHFGKFVVLNFWATWCKPCIKEMPDFQALSLRSDVAVLGLAYEDTSDAELKAFITKMQVSYPMSKVDVYEALPVPLETPKGLPTTWVFDPKGALIKKFLGPVTRADIEKVLIAPNTVKK